MAYIMSDIIIGILILLVIWKLDARSTPKSEKDEAPQKANVGLDVFRKILTIPFLILIFGAFLVGLSYGAEVAYLNLHLQNNLDASSSLISHCITIGSISQALFLLIADKVIDKVGCINSIACGIFIEAGKLFLFGWINDSPPYFALGLHFLNFSLWGYSWVAILKYGFQITPPYLVGTMTAISTAFTSVLGTLS